MSEQQEQKETLIKKVLGYIPAFSILIITFGIIKKYIYFDYFGIDITSYLSVSELWLSASDDLLAITVGIIIFIFHAILLSKIEKKQIKITPNHLKNKEPKEPSARETNWIKIFSITGIIIMICLIYFYFFSDTKRVSYISLFVLLIAALFTLVLHFTDTPNGKFNFTASISMVIFVFIIIYIFLSTLNKAESAERGLYIGTVIKTQDSCYISTDTSFYIGRTNNYLFILNKRKKNLTILPSDNVIYISESKIDIHKKSEKE